MSYVMRSYHSCLPAGGVAAMHSVAVGVSIDATHDPKPTFRGSPTPEVESGIQSGCRLESVQPSASPSHVTRSHAVLSAARVQWLVTPSIVLVLSGCGCLAVCGSSTQSFATYTNAHCAKQPLYKVLIGIFTMGVTPNRLDATSFASQTATMATPNVVSVSGSNAKTYYLAPTGRETNNGTSASTPWVTPNHIGLKCGDMIVAAPGNYDAMTIDITPNCSTHNAVWVKCEIFDECKINHNVWTQGGILVTASYWAFLGWDVTASGGQYAACYQAVPNQHISIHDIYFINDIADGCMAGGFVAAPVPPYGVDYFAVVGDIAYDAAKGSAYCYSGVSIYEPVAADKRPGTHIYISQVFAWHNVEPSRCHNGKSTDGEGVILDTFNGSQGGLAPYTQQTVVDNVLAIFNGAAGILAGGGSGNSSGPMYVRGSTAYGNFINTNQNQRICGQIESVGWPPSNAAHANNYTYIFLNLAVPSAIKEPGCGNNPAYAYYLGNLSATDKVYNNAGYSSAGYDIGIVGPVTGFMVGTGNLFTSNPEFANTVEPNAPSCRRSTSVISCMASTISDFRPTNPLLTAYGYKPPRMTRAHDPLFPQWLCNDNLPSGIVTTACEAE